MRGRASAFSNRWQGETRERAEKDSFWNEFFEIFGVARRRMGVFEYVAQRYSTGRHGFIDLLVPGEMAVEHKSAGQDLPAAMDQLVDYLSSLRDIDVPHTLVVCDFSTFVVRTLEDGTSLSFALSELPAHVERFSFLAGHPLQNQIIAEEDANLRAAELLSTLHDALDETGYRGHALRLFIVRLLYILFADDTQIWSKHLVTDYLLVKTADDGSDVGRKITEIFEILDTPHDARSPHLDNDLKDLAYVNGGLFSETLRAPTFTTQMRIDLLAACMFDWSILSPAIFGSIFQNVMTPAERRRLGAHYTSERDILRTIRPLFMDDLEEQLLRTESGTTQERLRKLRKLRDKLPTLTFLDPACGCGNFLMIAYRELRGLELRVLLAIRKHESSLTDRQRGGRRAPSEQQTTLDVSLESQVNVGQFYGIEIDEFPARIAETAMHLVDHQCNLELSAAFGDYYVRLPIADMPHIAAGQNALRATWRDVLSAEACDYIFGNPPFSGQYNKTPEQTADLQLVWGTGYNGYLDYVTGWYVKAQQYVGARATKIAFVSTNSICQGEPVAPLWEPLMRDGFSIDFAHRTFLWTSEASGRAGVHVIIVGFSQGDKSSTSRRLFDYPVGGRGEPTIKQVSNINAYLADAPSVFVRPRSAPLSGNLTNIHYGSKVSDGGHLLVTARQYDEVFADPHARKYLRRFIGARELIHNTPKWCLWMPEFDPVDVEESALLRKRIAGVVATRQAGQDDEIRAGAARPTEFLRDKQPRSNYLAIPAHVGEARPYFPVGYFGPEVISGNHNFVAADIDGFLFAILSSAMFITWMRGTAGRIRADLRFSKTLSWNNFPIPAVGEPMRTRIVEAGSHVREARSEYPERSLSQLYEPMQMPSALTLAHQTLDRLVDKAMGNRRRVRDNSDRLSVLFERFADATR
jgi:hypothetical protein